MSHPSIAILGAGEAVPVHVRRDDDPIFAALRSALPDSGAREREIFSGKHERRYLAPGEELEQLVIQAGRAALESARVRPEEVDRLYGYLSVSEYVAPNALYRVHRGLALRQHVMVVPVNSEFTNFTAGLVLAWEAILAGHSKLALVAVGSSWTRNLDYRHGHATSIGDGAGAAVVGPGDKLVLVDYSVDTFSDEYGVMTMRRRPESGLEQPTYDIDSDSGIKAYLSTGMDGPVQQVRELLKKHGLTGDDITLITHQSTRGLMNHWKENLRPRVYLDTFTLLGNMTCASVPVTLARAYRELHTPYLVLHTMGIGAHQFAVLVRV